MKVAPKLWISFHEIKGTAKTRRWDVMAKDGAWLGIVGFHAQWRRYAFFPVQGSIFEADCLRDMAEFCETMTAAWRAELKTKKTAR